MSKKAFFKQTAKAMAITVIVVITASLVWTHVVPYVTSDELSNMAESLVINPFENPGADSSYANQYAKKGQPDIQQASYNDIDENSSHTYPADIPDLKKSSGGILMGVIDGDTLDVDGIRIRLALVDAPEIGQPGYDAARSFVMSHCPPHSFVSYDIDDKQKKDIYDRHIGKVWCYGYPASVPEHSLNSELVRNGHAEVISKSCKSSEYGKESWIKPYC